MNQIWNLHSRKAENKNFADSKIQLIKLNVNFISFATGKVMTRKLFFIEEEKERKKFHHRSDEKKFEKFFSST